MAKRSENGLQELPVKFGNVNIGEGTARVALKVERSAVSLAKADKLFCERRLNGKITLNRPGDAEGQGVLIETDHEVSGAFDTKSFNVTSKSFSSGLTFSLAEIDITELARFGKGSGKLIVENSGPIPEDEEEED